MRLVVLVHGLHGDTTDLSYLSSQLKEQLGPSVRILAPACNEQRTQDGIESGGRRLAVVIEQELNAHQNIEELDIISHSLGGLYSRFAIYTLEEKGVLSNRNLKLGSFITLATPHIGSRQHCRVYGEWPTLFVANIFLDRTGSQLLLDDGDENFEPLLVRMTRPSFLDPLKKFRHLLCYSNLQFDPSVHYSTAAVRRQNPFALRLPPLGSAKVLPDPKPELPLPEALNTQEVNGFDRHFNTMHTRLVDLPWKRFAVVGRPILAHTDIVVRRTWINSYGESVIQHVIQHLKNSAAQAAINCPQI